MPSYTEMHSEGNIHSATYRGKYPMYHIWRGMSPYPLQRGSSAHIWGVPLCQHIKECLTPESRHNDAFLRWHSSEGRGSDRHLASLASNEGSACRVGGYPPPHTEGKSWGEHSFSLHICSEGSCLFSSVSVRLSSAGGPKCPHGTFWSL